MKELQRKSAKCPHDCLNLAILLPQATYVDALNYALSKTFCLQIIVLQTDGVDHTSRVVYRSKNFCLLHHC